MYGINTEFTNYTIQEINRKDYLNANKYIMHLKSISNENNSQIF